MLSKNFHFFFSDHDRRTDRFSKIFIVKIFFYAGKKILHFKDNTLGKKFFAPVPSAPPQIFLIKNFFTQIFNFENFSVASSKASYWPAWRQLYLQPQRPRFWRNLLRGAQSLRRGRRAPQRPPARRGHRCDQQTRNAHHEGFWFGHWNWYAIA